MSYIKNKGERFALNLDYKFDYDTRYRYIVRQTENSLISKPVIDIFILVNEKARERWIAQALLLKVFRYLKNKHGFKKIKLVDGVIICTSIEQALKIIDVLHVEVK